jgi:hypothetical protein
MNDGYKVHLRRARKGKAAPLTAKALRMALLLAYAKEYAQCRYTVRPVS